MFAKIAHNAYKVKTYNQSVNLLHYEFSKLNVFPHIGDVILHKDKFIDIRIQRVTHKNIEKFKLFNGNNKMEIIKPIYGTFDFTFSRKYYISKDLLCCEHKHFESINIDTHVLLKPNECYKIDDFVMNKLMIDIMETHNDANLYNDFRFDYMKDVMSKQNIPSNLFVFLSIYIKRDFHDFFV